MFTSRLTGIPFSFTAHAKDIYTSDPRQIREKIGLSRFVVTCTEYNKKHLREISDGHPTPIHRNYHGIDIPQPSLYSVRVDVGEVLAIHPRRPSVRAALSIGMRQNVFAVHLVVQGIEAKVSFTLRFRV